MGGKVKINLVFKGVMCQNTTTLKRQFLLSENVLNTLNPYAANGK